MISSRLPARLSALALAVLLLSCGSGPEAEPVPQRPVVCCTIFPITDLVRNVAGPHIETVCLLPPGASPHTFEPGIHDLKAASHAKVLFTIGLGFDAWAERLLRGSTGAGTRMEALAKSAKLLPLETPHEQHHKQAGMKPEAAHGDTHDPDHGETRLIGSDPHVWLDPLNAVLLVERIAEVLCEIDPPHASDYRQNASAYSARLRELHEEMRGLLNPARGKPLAGFHGAYAYFTARYGLHIPFTVAAFPGREPSVLWMKRLREGLRSAGASVILVEPQLSPKAAEVLARDTGAALVVFDPLGSDTDAARGTYIDLMRFNAENLHRAFAKR